MGLFWGKTFRNSTCDFHVLRHWNIYSLAQESKSVFQPDVVSTPKLRIGKRPGRICHPRVVVQFEIDHTVMISVVVGDDLPSLHFCEC